MIKYKQLSSELIVHFKQMIKNMVQSSVIKKFAQFVEQIVRRMHVASGNFVRSLAPADVDHQVVENRWPWTMTEMAPLKSQAWTGPFGPS